MVHLIPPVEPRKVTRLKPGEFSASAARILHAHTPQRAARFSSEKELRSCPERLHCVRFGGLVAIALHEIARQVRIKSLHTQQPPPGSQHNGLFNGVPGEGNDLVIVLRSEERRVGKECRARWSSSE